MSSSHFDRNLLFGLLALQNNFITREQLIAAVSVLITDKSRSLAEILQEQRSLPDDVHELLSALVRRVLQQNDNDPEKTLAKLSSIRELRDDLKKLGDADIEATLSHVAKTRQTEKAGPEDTLEVNPSKGERPRFRILRPHAAGGLGQVYVARDDELNRDVALKEIKCDRADDPASRSRFLLEAEITGGLEHPGIVPVYGLGQYADGRPYYAMRFIRGDSLKEAVTHFHSRPDNRNHYDSVEFRKLLGRFIDVCNAIEYAHSRGVLHRDLKPGNIMLGKYGETLVVDWGLAKPRGKTKGYEQSDENTLQPRSGSRAGATQTGSAVGTPAYMSPEQAAGRLSELGPASDVYSLGATLYSVLTGQLAFPKGDTGEILRDIQVGNFPTPRLRSPHVPRPLEAICLRAMALRQTDRYVSAQALADDVERYLADEPVAALSEPLSLRTRRWLRKHPRSVAALAASLLIGTTSALVIASIVTGMNGQLSTANSSLQVANIAERKAKNDAEKKHLEAEQARQNEERFRHRAELAEMTAKNNEAQASAAAKLAEEEKRVAQHFVAAYGRTLLQLPREDLKRRRNESQYFSTVGELFERPESGISADRVEDRLFATLAELIDRYDPQGLSGDQSLLFIGGWVCFRRAAMQGNPESRLAFLADSSRRYEHLERATALDDRYRIRSSALVAASNTYVQAAFWTKIKSSEEIRPDLTDAEIADKEPSLMTKYEHLRRAVTLAQMAQSDKDRRLPEEAYFAEGNALEDLAYYCKIFQHYPGAAKAFDTASAVTTGPRPNVYALLSRGRCLYRWSRESINESMTHTVRHQKLREAYATLKRATDSMNVDDVRDVAEANWWLAQVLAEAAYKGPGSITGGEETTFETESLNNLHAVFNRNPSRKAEAQVELTRRLQSYEQARQQTKLAAGLAETIAPQDRAVYLLDSLEIGMELAGYLRQLGSLLPGTSRDDLLTEIRNEANRFLELSQRDPLISKAYALRALNVLVRSHAASPTLGGGNAALVELKKYETVFSGHSDLDKLVDVLLWEATSGDGEVAISRAEQVSSQIKDQAQKDRAIARCLRARTAHKLSDLEKRLAGAKTAGRRITIKVSELEEIVDNNLKSEGILAKAKGPDVVANLELLRQQPLADLPERFEQTFKLAIEAHRLREFLTETASYRADAIAAAKAWLTLARLDHELVASKRTEAFSAPALPIAKRLHACLKPRVFLLDGGLSPDDRITLEILEQKLSH